MSYKALIISNIIGEIRLAYAVHSYVFIVVIELNLDSVQQSRSSLPVAVVHQTLPDVLYSP
jgi:hypothetical protein